MKKVGVLSLLSLIGLAAFAAFPAMESGLVKSVFVDNEAFVGLALSLGILLLSIFSSLLADGGSLFY